MSDVRYGEMVGGRAAGSQEPEGDALTGGGAKEWHAAVMGQQIPGVGPMPERGQLVGMSSWSTAVAR